MWRRQWRGFEQKLLVELQRQQHSSLFCDTLLQAEGISVPAHSCVLAALSPTLAQVLSTAPAPLPGQSRLLELQAVGAQALLQLVGFLYCGELQGENRREWEQLLEAAAKLGIQGLVEEEEGDGRRGEREGAERIGREKGGAGDGFEQMSDSERRAREVKEEVWSVAEGGGRREKWPGGVTGMARDVGTQTDCEDAVELLCGAPPSCQALAEESQGTGAAHPSKAPPRTPPSQAPGLTAASGGCGDYAPPPYTALCPASVSQPDGDTTTTTAAAAAAAAVAVVISNTITTHPAVCTETLTDDITADSGSSVSLAAVPPAPGDAGGSTGRPPLAAPEAVRSIPVGSAGAESKAVAVLGEGRGRGRGGGGRVWGGDGVEKDRKRRSQGSSCLPKCVPSDEEEPGRMRSRRVKGRGRGGVRGRAGARQSIPRARQGDRQISINIRLRRRSRGELWEIVSVREEGVASAPMGGPFRSRGRSLRRQLGRISMNKDGFSVVQRRGSRVPPLPQCLFRALTLTRPPLAPVSLCSPPALTLSPPHKPRPLPCPGPALSLLHARPPSPPIPEDSCEQMKKLLDDILMGLDILPPIAAETDDDCPPWGQVNAGPPCGDFGTAATAAGDPCFFRDPRNGATPKPGLQVAAGDASCSGASAATATGSGASGLVETGFVCPGPQEGSGPGPDSWLPAGPRHCGTLPLNAPVTCRDAASVNSCSTRSQNATHPPVLQQAAGELNILDHFLWSCESQSDRPRDASAQGHRDGGSIVVQGESGGAGGPNGIEDESAGMGGASGLVAPGTLANGSDERTHVSPATSAASLGRTAPTPKPRMPEFPFPRGPEGEPRASEWDELRLPGRLSPLAAGGGLPKNLAPPASPRQDARPLPLQLPPWLSPFPVPLDSLFSPAASVHSRVQVQSHPCPHERPKWQRGVRCKKMGVGGNNAGRKIVTRGWAREERRKRCEEQEESKGQGNAKKVRRDHAPGGLRIGQQQAGQGRSAARSYCADGGGRKCTEARVCAVRLLRSNVCAEGVRRRAGLAEKVPRTAKCAEKAKRSDVRAEKANRSIVCTEKAKRSGVCAEEADGARLANREVLCPQSLKGTVSCTESALEPTACTGHPVPQQDNRGVPGEGIPKRGRGRPPKKRPRPGARALRERREQEAGGEPSVSAPAGLTGAVMHGREDELPRKRRRKDDEEEEARGSVLRGAVTVVTPPPRTLLKREGRRSGEEEEGECGPGKGETDRGRETEEDTGRMGGVGERVEKVEKGVRGTDGVVAEEDGGAEDIEPKESDAERGIEREAKVDGRAVEGKTVKEGAKQEHDGGASVRAGGGADGQIAETNCSAERERVEEGVVEALPMVEGERGRAEATENEDEEDLAAKNRPGEIDVTEETERATGRERREVERRRKTGPVKGGAAHAGLERKRELKDGPTLNQAPYGPQPFDSHPGVTEVSTGSWEQEEEEDVEVDVLECSSPAPPPLNPLLETVGAGLSYRDLSEQAEEEEGEVDVIGEETD